MRRLADPSLLGDISKVTRISSGPFDIGPAPSPDSSLLAYSSERTGDREIYLRDLLRGEERKLTGREGRDGYVKFSPDGLKLAYHSGINGADGSYVVIRMLVLETGEMTELSCRGWSGDH